MNSETFERQPISRRVFDGLSDGYPTVRDPDTWEETVVVPPEVYTRLQEIERRAVANTKRTIQAALRAQRKGRR